LGQPGFTNSPSLKDNLLAAISMKIITNPKTGLTSTYDYCVQNCHTIHSIIHYAIRAQRPALGCMYGSIKFIYSLYSVGLSKILPPVI
jgi:hypothetical protein